MSDEHRILTCVYCGQEYPQDTPAWGDEVLTNHIKSCEKHPMRVAERKITKLRKSLSAFIGTEDPKELDLMEAYVRLAPMPDSDKANIINAIDVLRETNA